MTRGAHAGRDRASPRAQRSRRGQPAQRRGAASRWAWPARRRQRWTRGQRAISRRQAARSDVAGGLGAVAKVLRMMLQSAVLAVGAYLVINQEATAGIIIAGSILQRAGAGAGRPRHRQLEGLRRGAPELAAPDQPAGGPAGRRRSRCRCQRRRGGSRSRASASCRPASRSSSSQDVTFTLEAGQGPRRHRAERVGQVVAGARAGRRLAAGARQGAARRRRPRQWRPTCSAATSAICRRTSSCSPARSRRTSPASIPTPTRRRSSPPPRPPASTT